MVVTAGRRLAARVRLAHPLLNPEEVAHKLVTFPVFPSLTREQQGSVGEMVKRDVTRKSSKINELTL